eukprot:jgi/Mesvir1/23800/Mv10613-RA.1
MRSASNVKDLLRDRRIAESSSLYEGDEKQNPRDLSQELEKARSRARAVQRNYDNLSVMAQECQKKLEDATRDLERAKAESKELAEKLVDALERAEASDIASSEHKGCAAKVESLTASLQDSQKAAEEARKAKDAVAAQCSALEGRIQDVERDKGALRDKAGQWERKVEEMRAEARAVQQSVAALTHKCEGLERQLAQKQAEGKSLQTNTAQMASLSNELELTKDKLKKNMSQLQASLLRQSELEVSLSGLEGRHKMLEGQLAVTLRSQELQLEQLRATSAELQQAKQRCAGYARELEAANARAAAVDASRAAAEQSVAESHRLLAAMAGEKAEAGGRVDVMARAMEGLQKELTDAKRALLTLEQESGRALSEAQAQAANSRGEVVALREQLALQDGSHKRGLTQLRAQLQALDGQMGQLASEHAGHLQRAHGKLQALARASRDGLQQAAAVAKRLRGEHATTVAELRATKALLADSERRWSASEAAKSKVAPSDLSGVEASKQENGRLTAELLQLRAMHEQEQRAHAVAAAEARELLANAELALQNLQHDHDAQLAEREASMAHSVGLMEKEMALLKRAAQEERESMRKLMEDERAAAASHLNQQAGIARKHEYDKEMLAAQLDKAISQVQQCNKEAAADARLWKESGALLSAILEETARIRTSLRQLEGGGSSDASKTPAPEEGATSLGNPGTSGSDKDVVRSQIRSLHSGLVAMSQGLSELGRKGAGGKNKSAAEIDRDKELTNTVNKLLAAEEAQESCYTCMICLAIFDHPITCAPCGHTFCAKCLAETAGGSGASSSSRRGAKGGTGSAGGETVLKEGPDGVVCSGPMYCTECDPSKEVAITGWVFNMLLDTLCSKYEFKLSSLRSMTKILT